MMNEKVVPVNKASKQLDWKQFGQIFLETSPNALVVSDTSFNLLVSNSKARDYLDINSTTSIQTALPEIADPAAAVLKTAVAMQDVPITRHNRKFIARISPIVWKEKPRGLLCLFEDVTLLEKVSRKMRSHQEMSMELDTIINSSHDGLWICDGQGTVIRINPASEQLAGIKGKAFIGKSIRAMVEKGVIDRSVTLKVLASKKTESIIQNTRNGNKLLLTGTPVFDKAGQLFRVVVNERDITEIEALKQALNEKQALKDKLEEDLLELQLGALKAKKIIAKSRNFKTILDKAVKIGRVDSSVLIFGESGTGKGVIAEMIHSHSSRRDKPMIKLNCGTIPDSLVESELFGYKKGAFTGADKNKAGRFEVADNGILFLDEIAELPLSSQVKLLRFLEDGYLSRIGETTSKKVNVRIIAATNRNLEKMVADKSFRQDLYYRLKVIPIHLPPLRDRKACILPLVSHYINYFCRKHKIKSIPTLTGNAADTLENYAFPGNIRELMNLCERLVVMSENNRIRCKDLPHSILDFTQQDSPTRDLSGKGGVLREMLADYEKQILQDTMNRHPTQSGAARALGLNQSSIARKLKKYRLI